MPEKRYYIIKKSYYRISKKEYANLILMQHINLEEYEKYLRSFETLNIAWDEENIEISITD